MYIAKLLGVIFATVLMTSLTLDAANAGLYEFAFSGSGFSASGDFVTSGTVSPYSVIDVTGTASDSTYNSGAPSTITGAIPGFLGANNLLYYPGDPLYVDGFGIAFSTADANKYWIGRGSPNTYSIASFGSLFIADYPLPLPLNTFTVTPVPESSTWVLIMLAFASLAFLYRRRNINPSAKCRSLAV
jgi:hypothetical protein